MSAPAAPPLDTAPLDGFSFACQPTCGLCCFAEPQVPTRDLAPLIALLPSVPIVGDGPTRRVPAWPDGGACRLLDGDRCRAHAARPAPCREYPIVVTVTHRLQATLVLSCPGVDLGRLRGRSVPAARHPPAGLDRELAAVRARIDRSVGGRLRVAARRARTLPRAEPGATEELARRLPERLDSLAARWPTLPEPPDPADGLERLPIVHDSGIAPVAFAAGIGGWELLRLLPTGGVDRTLGIVPPPDRMPALAADGRELLVGYLRYWLERDALLSWAIAAGGDRRPLGATEAFGHALEEIAAVVVARADVLGRHRGRGATPLGFAEVAEGIRASDQDLLDGATAGIRL